MNIYDFRKTQNRYFVRSGSTFPPVIMEQVAKPDSIGRQPDTIFVWLTLINGKFDTVLQRFVKSAYVFCSDLIRTLEIRGPCVFRRFSNHKQSRINIDAKPAFLQVAKFKLLIPKIRCYNTFLKIV